jgi:hypothetical protein
MGEWCSLVYATAGDAVYVLQVRRDDGQLQRCFVISEACNTEHQVDGFIPGVVGAVAIT